MFGIQDDIIRVYYTKGRCYCERDNFGKWRCVENDTRIPERGLHGGFRRECLLQDEIQRLWKKGIYGLVSIEDGEIKQGLSDDFNEPQREENHAAITQADMLGLSWGTRTKEFAGKTSGWKQGKQSPEKSEMGNASGELERQESAWDGKRGGEALEFEVYGRREEPHPLGDKKRVMQPETCSAGIGSVAIRNIQHCPCAPGMTLWVRETTYLYGRWAKNGLAKTGKQKHKFVWDIKQPAIYAADDKPDVICTKKDQIGYFKRPSIHMPRDAARIFLRVKNVRVERVQDITVDVCRLEGCCCSDCLQTGPHSPDCKCDTLFYNVWNDINAKRGYGWEITRGYGCMNSSGWTSPGRNAVKLYKMVRLFRKTLIGLIAKK